MRSLGKQVSDDADIASRYDPKFMSRIMSQGDDDSFDSLSSAEFAGIDLDNGGNKQQKQGNKKKRKSKNGSKNGVGLFCRQTILIFSLVGIIIAASVVIGYAVVNNEPSEKPYSVVANGKSEQALLEIAERVVTVCSESRLDKNMSKCQKLCKKNMCCFESGEYSCEDDERKTCAAYAGCKALIEGIPSNAEEEDEE